MEDASSSSQAAISPERKLAENRRLRLFFDSFIETEFTPASVHAILKEVTARDRTIVVPAEDSRRVILLTRALCQLRSGVFRELMVANKRRACARIAAVCKEIIEIVHQVDLQTAKNTRRKVSPQLRQLLSAIGCPVPTRTAQAQHRQKLRSAMHDLHALASAASVVAQNPLLQPGPGFIGDFWQAYVDDLVDLFHFAVTRVGGNPKPLGNPLYAFIVRVVPGLTGEHVTFQQVRTHLARGRPVPTHKHRL